MFLKIDRKPIEEVFVPGFGLHRVHRFHDASPHQTMPKAVDNGAREATIGFVRHQLRQLFKSFWLTGFGIDRSEFGKQPSRLGLLSDRLSQRWTSSGVLE